MRKVKLILLSFCGLLLVCLILIAVLIFTIDENNLASTLSRITEYRIEIDGPLSLDISMEPLLSVSEILVRSDAGEDGLLSAQIGQLRTKIALKQLLFGILLIKELDIHDVKVTYVEEVSTQTEKEEKRDLRGKLADIEIPILESVTLQNITVSYLDKESDYSMNVLLHSFNIDDVQDTGPLYMKGSGAVNKTQFSIDGQLGSIMDALRQASPYPIDLSLSIADLAFRISGTIDDLAAGAGLNIIVTADEAELSNMLEVLKAEAPRLGYLDLDAKVTGDIEAPRISDLTLKVSGEPNVELSIKGSVENLLTGEGTDIALSGLTSNIDMIHLLLPEDFHAINELELSGKLRNVEEDYLIDTVRADLKQGNESTIKASGSIFIEHTLVDLEKSKCDLRLNMEAKNTQLLKSVLFDWLPDTGPVNGEARLTGPLKAPEMRDINLTAGKAQSVWIHAQGHVGSIPLGPGLPVSGIDMSLSIKADEAPQLFANLGIKMPELDDVSGEIHLYGSGERLIFDGITLHMTDPEGVAADVSGNLIMESQEHGKYLETFDLDVSMTAPTVASFRRLLAAQALPDLGPVKLTYNLKGTNEVFSIENLLLQAGHPGPIQLEWSGRIDNVVPGGKLPSDVKIDSSTYVEKTSLLSPYIGFSIPDFGQLRGTSKIVGRIGGYGIDDFQALIGNRADYVMKATGDVAYVMRGTEVAFEGIDVSFELGGLDSRIIAEHLEEELLDIGKINGSLSVTGSPEDLALSDIEFLSLSQEGLKTSIHGGIEHIRPDKDMPFQGINIELAATTPDMSPIEKATELDLPKLGPLNIKAHIKDRDDDLNVETLLLHAGPEKEPTLLIDGRMHDILSTDTMDFSFSFEAASKPWAEELYGHRVPEDHRIKGKAALTGSRNHFNIVATAASGKTHINTSIDMSRENERRNIIAHISAPKIFLDDLGIYPEERERKKTAKKDKEIHREKIFSDEPYPFPELKNLDLSLTIETEEIIGSGFVLNDFDIDIMLKDGLMLIDPARMTYADGFVSMESSIDMRGPKAEMKLNLQAEDIDTGDLFAYTHSPMILGGHLNLSIDLISSGNSPREVVSALNGELGIAIEHGQIKQIADLLGADAIDFVTTAKELGTYQKLNCLAVNFTFDDGIGNSQVIYIDTKSVRSQGKGTVNLRDETIDVVVQPRPKIKRLGGSSPVTIQGPLNKPSAKKLPFKEAARLSGEILMPFVFLPARGAGYMWYLLKNDEDEESPCLKPETKPDVN